MQEDIFFLFGLSFLTGIACASIGLSFSGVLLVSFLLCFALLAFHTDARLALCSTLLFALGGWYLLRAPVPSPASPRPSPPVVLLVQDAFRRSLTPMEAGFLSGLTLGVHDGMPKSFLQDLSVAGVRHLVTVSGLHVATLVFLVLGVLLIFLPRRWAIACASVFLFLYLAMTGFHAAAVRAAVMAGVAAVAKETGRVYAPARALLAAALLLALFDPRVLIFDVGFQLSFLAILGILFLSTILRRLLRLGAGPGFFSWKHSLLTTLSAQIATAPLVIAQFHTFSLTALFANVLVGGIAPFLLGFGFFIAIFSFTLPPLAALASLLSVPFLEYAIFMVRVSARAALIFNPSIGPLGIGCYYVLLALALYRFSEPARV